MGFYSFASWFVGILRGGSGKGGQSTTKISKADFEALRIRVTTAETNINNNTATGLTNTGNINTLENNQRDKLIKYAPGYVQKQKYDGSTYIMNLKTGATSTTATWANRGTV